MTVGEVATVDAWLGFRLAHLRSLEATTRWWNSGARRLYRERIAFLEALRASLYSTQEPEPELVQRVLQHSES